MKTGYAILATLLLFATALTAETKTNTTMNTTTKTPEWDKTFPKSDKADHRKVEFNPNRSLDRQ